MKDEAGRSVVELSNLGETFSAAVNRGRRIADLEISQECHVALRLAGHEPEVDIVTGLFVAMSEPASVRDQLGQGRLFRRHRSACGQSGSLLQGVP